MKRKLMDDVKKDAKEQRVYCPFCGGEVRVGDSLCVHCGKGLPERLIVGLPPKNVRKVSITGRAVVEIEEVRKDNPDSEESPKIRVDFQERVIRKNGVLLIVLSLLIAIGVFLIILFNKKNWESPEDKGINQLSEEMVASVHSMHSNNDLEKIDSQGQYLVLTNERGTQVDESNNSLKVGSEIKLTASSMPVKENDLQITWKSENDKIATVDSEGSVKACGGGITVIHAISETGIEGSCTISVYCDVPRINEIENVDNGIKISWENSEGAAAYQVLCKYGNEDWKPIGNTTSLQFVTSTRDGINPFKTCNKYLFSVRCIDSMYLNSHYTSEETEGEEWRYSATSDITEINCLADEVFVQWKDVENVHGYNIQCSLKSDFSSENTLWRVPVSKGFSETIKGLYKGKTYYFRVRTYVKYGGVEYYSAWSDAHSIET